MSASLSLVGLCDRFFITQDLLYQGNIKDVSITSVKQQAITRVK
ncbi:hypothetical protein [Calothrix sp. PCC 6303]|nr:hypothetical protein [Calothrix sp. PCC 6303]